MRKLYGALLLVGALAIIGSRSCPKTVETVQQQAAPDATPYVRVKAENMHWFLGACGSVKANGAWLREWLLLQRMAGLDHMWLVNDDDEDDGTAAILQEFQNEGFITIIPGKFPNKFPGCEGSTGRPPDVKESNCVAPKFCFHEASPHVDWLLFIDSDEFMFPRTGCSVAQHIKNHCNPWQAHISVGWERFGGSRFSAHPAGLMIENFLESAGECEHETTNNHKNLANNPFGIVGTCIHRKTIYNTKCMTTDHAGWIHWPVNTTEFHERQYPYTQMNGKDYWANVAGPEGAPFKDEKCTLITYQENIKKCTAWLEEGGGSKEVVEYSEECCTAGIGYNHYGYKSSEYWGHKMLDVGNAERGRKLDKSKEWRIDVSGVVSHGILKYLRALRKAHTLAGVHVSRRVSFVDDQSGTCFTERGFVYIPRNGTLEHTLGDIATADACCTSCIKTANCSGFSFYQEAKTCKLFTPPILANSVYNGPNKPPARRRLIRTVIPADRLINREAISGVVLASECSL
eukprot:TRINITY_DN777_c0_g1_i7.p1 TRINITY_DN777_c0_g1~~TRINITY_DN777_c0_g1_i7.p1  ORF type:complete len:516 (+),score=138.74 TRINITY_DN777_c0_g1_i7:43-1590(+)